MRKVYGYIAGKFFRIFKNISIIYYTGLSYWYFLGNYFFISFEERLYKIYRKNCHNDIMWILSLFFYSGVDNYDALWENSGGRSSLFAFNYSDRI